MGSSFYGFNISSAGLFSAQKNLDVVSHNITNANTPGYSRQEAVQKTVRPEPTYDGTGMVGGGAYIETIHRIRDEYLDAKYWGENDNAGEWDAKQSRVEDIQSLFGEPSDSGFTTIMNDFFNALQDVAKDPNSPSARSVVQQTAFTLANYFNSMATRLTELQSSLNQEVNSEVNQINSLGEEIVRLNAQIFNYELTGHIANDLRDQRTHLVDKLSRLADIKVFEEYKGILPNGLEDKRMAISIGGKTFISHDKNLRMELTPRVTKLNAQDVVGLFKIQWEDGDDLIIRSGKLKGYLDVRDGNDGVGSSPTFKGVPFYLRRLDQFVQTFSKAFNEGYVDLNGDRSTSAAEDGVGHVDGYGLDPDGAGPRNAPTSLRFFTIRDPITKEPLGSETFVQSGLSRTEIEAKYSQMTAANFAINPEITNFYYTFAASDSPDKDGNIVNVSKLIELRHKTEMFSEGAPEDFMKSLITTIAIDKQQADRLAENHKIITNLSENRRLSESGVSLDEEMGNMVKHQQAYAASAQMISTWSEIYEILLNRTGMK